MSIEFPEPFLKLVMASRGNDQIRQVKHMHQMCQGHYEKLVTASNIKSVALIDGYIQNAKMKSSIGV